jgi:AcrR family transcriptional regulator
VARLTRIESKERTRTLLLEATRTCVSERGYEGTSIADIAERAGFSKGAFFSNFETKEDAFLEVLRQEKARDITALQMILQTPDPVVLSQVLDAYIDSLEQNRDCAILDIEMQLHAARHPAFQARYEALSAELRSALGHFVGKFFERHGKYVPMTEPELADLFLSLFQGLMVRRVSDPGGHMRRVLQALMLSAPARAPASGPAEPAEPTHTTGTPSGI